MRALFALIFLIFAGCSTKSAKVEFVNHEIGTKYRYYENNLSLQNVNFFFEIKGNSRIFKANLKALSQLNVDENLTLQEIDNINVAIINFDVNHSVSLQNLEQKELLKSSRGFKFYEFKEGLIENSIFISKYGVCDSWADDKPIFARVVSSYYPFLQNDDTNPLGVMFEVNLIKNKGAHVRSFVVLDELFDDKTKQKVAKMIKSEEFTHTLKNDIIKQAKIVTLVCEKI